MGYYIEPTNGGPTGKAASLIQSNGAVKQINPAFLDKESGNVTVCVVENGFFDAAAVVYSKSEMDAFQGNCGRKKTWLTMDREVVKGLGSEGYASLLD